jgi:3-hydroxyisobutyrate dehydrogenase
MLPSTPQVESVYLDPGAGVLAGIKDLPVDTEPLVPPPEALGEGSTGSQGAKEKSAMRTMVDSITGTGNEHQPHTILIDQTTLDPTFAMSLAERVQSETLGRALMLDAPVSGGESSLRARRARAEEAGTVAAASGNLTIMFGSPSELASSHAVPLLQRMAREGGVIPCGRNGTGVGVKVCNKYVSPYTSRIS